MTEREIADLRAQTAGPRQISGKKSHEHLDHLVEAGFVKSTAISMDAVLYEITGPGRCELAKGTSL